MIVYFEKWTRRYWATQAEAKDAAREARVCGGEAAGYEKVDVPTSGGRDALCDFLNDLETAARNDAAAPAEPSWDEIKNSNAPEMQARAREIMTPSEGQASFTATEIADFILDRASVSQVETIYACLGTRFAELVKERRA